VIPERIIFVSRGITVFSNSTLIDHPVPFSAIYSLWTATPHKEPGKFLILLESPSQKLTVSRVHKFLGAFANHLPKATISFDMCVHLSVSPHESARISPDKLPWNVTFRTCINPLTPNDAYSGRTAPLTSERCILYIYSTNIDTEYFKHGIYSPFFPLQNAVCFIILTYVVPVLFAFYIQIVLKLKKNNSGAKRLNQPVDTDFGLKSHKNDTHFT